MKLELKHLAGYLPYGLKIQTNSTNYKETYTLFSLDPFGFGFKEGELFFKRCKPILRPLSDLTKEIEVNGEKFVPIDKINEDKEYGLVIGSLEKISLDNLFWEDKCILNMLNIFEINKLNSKLIEWHFDIYGLIENNLAIDKNTIL